MQGLPYGAMPGGMNAGLRPAGGAGVASTTPAPMPGSQFAGPQMGMPGGPGGAAAMGARGGLGGQPFSLNNAAAARGGGMVMPPPGGLQPSGIGQGGGGGGIGGAGRPPPERAGAPGNGSALGPGGPGLGGLQRPPPPTSQPGGMAALNGTRAMGSGMDGFGQVPGGPNAVGPRPGMLQQGVGAGGGGAGDSGLLAMMGKGGAFMPGQPGLGPGNGFGGAVGGMGDLGRGEGEGDTTPFDMSDFPSLGGAGGAGDPASLLVAEGYGAVALQKQHPEFSIQNEDFPALPGAPGPGGGGGKEMPREDDGSGGAFAAQMGRGYQPGADGEAQHVAGDMARMNLGGGGNAFSDGLAVSAGFQAMQAQDLGALGGIGQAGGMQRQGSGAAGGPGGIDMLSQQQQFQQQQQLRQQQAQQQAQQHGGGGGGAPPPPQSQAQQGQAATAQPAAPASPVSKPAAQPSGKSSALPDRFGLLGLLSVIRMSDQDRTTLALGTDLTTLGLNLNSPDSLYKTFASPWADSPATPERELHLPACYGQMGPRLQPGSFVKFTLETLFYVFYSMPNDEAQLYAAEELSNRGWYFHKELKAWLARVPNTQPLVKTDTRERGSYFIFDVNQWERVRKDNFVLQYDQLEARPQRAVLQGPPDAAQAR